MSETWTIETGPRPGLAEAVTALHMGYYAEAVGFGPAFESVVRTGLEDFLPRLANGVNQSWQVMLGDTLAGHIAIDGEDLGSNTAHLRWFITSDALRGQGAGKALLNAAVSHCDAQGLAETRLWTFAGLNAARSLYERVGFRLAEEYEGAQWGKAMREQMFVRALGG